MRFQRLIFLICALFTLFILLSLGLSLSYPELPSQPGKIYFYSNQKRDDLGLLLQEAFKSAQKSIAISIFNFSDRQLLKTLKEAELRGVDVQIFADESAFYQLEKIFPQVCQDTKLQGLMHRKIVIIDDHLVFMGSAAFPKENELDSFLAQHGGSTNAFTEYEYTVFQIEASTKNRTGPACLSTFTPTHPRYRRRSSLRG